MNRGFVIDDRRMLVDVAGERLEHHGRRKVLDKTGMKRRNAL